MRRREFLGSLQHAVIVAPLGAQAVVQAPSLKGRFKQGVTRGVFGRGPAWKTAAARRRDSASKAST